MSELIAEQKVVDTVLQRFPVLEGRIRVQRRQRVIMDPLVRRDFEKVFAFLTNEAGFHNFHLVIGVDDDPNLGFIYAISNEDNVVLLVKQKAPKNDPVIKSVNSRFENSLWHERELVDLFGAVVEGLPDGPTYPLPDGWPEGNYPLRKEWKVEYFNKETMTYEPPVESEAAAEQGTEAE